MISGSNLIGGDPMSTTRYLTDEQRAKIEPLLPPPLKRKKAGGRGCGGIKENGRPRTLNKTQRGRESLE